MRVLLVGPYPPPHGGISVHVWRAHALMKRAGIQCRVLNIDPRAPESDAYLRVSGAAGLVKELVRHVCSDWTLNVHTNGHNRKSWLIALACALASQCGCGATLTLHSGAVRDYLFGGSQWRRTVARMACLLYERVICVNDDIASTLASLGIPEDHLETKPAFFPVDASTVPIPAEIEAWMNRHAPLISSTMFFRPEYGFDLLIRALAIVQRSHPKVGCVVIGSGEDRAEAETAIERFGMRDTVLLTGDVSHELCLQLMSRSSVFVRPTFCDGDSISVREAISLGVLVVGSNVGTRPEDTLLFEVGDIDGLVRQLENALMHGRSRGSIKM